MAAPGCKIYVGNLPSGIAERDLEDEFIRFGTLKSVWVARKPPGFGELLRHHYASFFSSVRVRLSGVPESHRCNFS